MGAPAQDLAPPRAAAQPGRSRAATAARTISAPALAVLAGVAAAAPIISSTVKAVHAGWMPAGDDGIIATRGWDVLSSHMPLVGQYSEAGLVIRGQVMHSPGPMLYWLLALPARYGTVASIAVTMCVLNTLAVIGCVAIARRRGGLPLMLAVAGGIALMCRSLPSEALHDIWNPAAGLFPFLLLAFLCWSLAGGGLATLPAIALLASFVVQTHLMYLAPSAMLLAIGVAGALAPRIARRRRGAAGEERLGWVHLLARRPRRERRVAGSLGAGAGEDGGSGNASAHSFARPPRSERGEQRRPGRARVLARRLRGERGGERRLWPWVLAALAVTAVCWSAPAIDQVQATHGNLGTIVSTAEHRGPTMGARVGWHAVVRSVGVRPWWVYRPASAWERKNDVLRAPSGTATASTIAILAVLALLVVLGAVARRRDLATAAAIGLLLCAALGIEAASNPSPRLLRETLGYTMWWGSEVGLWVWFTIAWAAWLGLAAASRAVARRSATAVARWPARRRMLASSATCFVGLLGVLALARQSAAGEAPDSHAYMYRAIHSIGASLERAIPPGRTLAYHLGPLDIATQPAEPAIRFLLVRHGDRPLSDGAYPRLGSYYVQGLKPVQLTVYVVDGTRRPAGMRLAGRVRFESPWGPQTLSAWVGPARQKRAQRRNVRRAPTSS